MRYIFLILLFSNLLSGQNYENNIIPVGNKELRFVNSSMIPYNVLKNNYASKVRKASETFTVVIPQGSATTNSLTWSQGTSLTSNVNSTPSTVLIPN